MGRPPSISPAVQERVGVLLGEGAAADHATAAGACRKILTLEAAFGTFVRVEGMELTPNAADQASRAGVRGRKGSLGTQRLAGSCFVERMMTVVATLKRQRRDRLDYLTAAGEASLRKGKAPSLLTPPTPANYLRDHIPPLNGYHGFNRASSSAAGRVFRTSVASSQPR